MRERELQPAAARERVITARSVNVCVCMCLYVFVRGWKVDVGAATP